MGRIKNKSMFYKVIKPFREFVKGDIVLAGFAHFCIVKVGSSTTKTEYLHKYYQLFNEVNPIKEGKLNECIVELKQWEVRKLRHHMTWRIWINDGARICNPSGAYGFSFDVLNDNKDLAPLPPVMCYDCMMQGNPWLPHIPPIEMTGMCVCCSRIKFLHYTQYAWPLNLSEKGFAQSILCTGKNFTNNIRSMYHGKRMKIYSGYDGTLDWFKQLESK